MNIEKFDFGVIIKGDKETMEEIKKSEDYMNMSFSISPEKYFDSRFDAQEKLFTEKFNSLQTQIETLSDKSGSETVRTNDKIETEVQRLEDKIDFEINSLKKNEVKGLENDIKIIKNDIKNLSDKMDAGFKAQDEKISTLNEKFEAKIDALDKRLTFGFTIVLAVLAVLVALHFIGR